MTRRQARRERLLIYRRPQGGGGVKASGGASSIDISHTRMSAMVDNPTEANLKAATFEDFRQVMLTREVARLKEQIQDPAYSEATRARAKTQLAEGQSALNTPGVVPDFINKGLTSYYALPKSIDRHTGSSKGYNSYHVTPKDFIALKRDLRNDIRTTTIKQANAADTLAKFGAARPYVRGKRWGDDLPASQFQPKAGDRIFTRVKDSAYGGGGYSINQKVKSVSPKLIKLDNPNNDKGGSQIAMGKFRDQLQNESYVIRGKQVHKLT